jgi:hypothetical protein
MSKGRKKLGSVIHPKTGIEIEYFLEGEKFVATVFGEKLSEPNASILKHKITEMIDCWMSFEWMPVIRVEIGDGQRYRDDGISFDHDRYYIAKGPAGSIVKVDWDVDEEHRKAKCHWNSDSTLKLTKFPFTAPIQTSDGWLIPYTDETWRGVEDIKAGIEHLKKRLTKLLTSRDGIKQLTQSGAKTLLLTN